MKVSTVSNVDRAKVYKRWEHVQYRLLRGMNIPKHEEFPYSIFCIEDCFIGERFPAVVAFKNMKIIAYEKVPEFIKSQKKLSEKLKEFRK